MWPVQRDDGKKRPLTQVILELKEHVIKAANELRVNLEQHAQSATDIAAQPAEPPQQKKRNFGSDSAFWCSNPMGSHARIDCLPLGIGVEEVRCLLEQHGYEIKKIEKTKGRHLSGFEIQFYVKDCKVTFGTSDYDSDGKKRIRDNVHGYVRASHMVLQEAVDKIKELLSRGEEVRPRATCPG